MLLLALSTAVALNVAPPTRAACADAPSATAMQAAPYSTSQHLKAAKQAVTSGDIDGARRAYRIAAALGRDEGCLPVQATHGLARLLYANQRATDAADVLLQLAKEANTAGNDDVEVNALVSAAWLHLQVGARVPAKEAVRRLHQLKASNELSTTTKALLKESLG